MNYLRLANIWMYEALTGTPHGASVHAGYAPQDVSYPVCVFQLIDAQDELCNGDVRTGLTITYDVRVSVEGESYPYALFHTIDGLLHGVSGVQDGARIHVVRESSYTQAPLIDGAPYREVGGFYTVRIG